MQPNVAFVAIVVATTALLLAGYHRQQDACDNVTREIAWTFSPVNVTANTKDIYVRHTRHERRGLQWSHAAINVFYVASLATVLAWGSGLSAVSCGLFALLGTMTDAIPFLATYEAGLSNTTTQIVHQTIPCNATTVDIRGVELSARERDLLYAELMADCAYIGLVPDNALFSSANVRPRTWKFVHRRCQCGLSFYGYYCILLGGLFFLLSAASLAVHRGCFDHPKYCDEQIV